MDIINLGHSISSKTITIERLSKDQDNLPSYVILGTPKLDRNEIYELIGVLKHEIRFRDSQLNELSNKDKK
jgi:hypothetical protein